ncbi:MAG: hypothetical protein ACOCRK_10760 [bacterium]
MLENIENNNLKDVKRVFEELTVPEKDLNLDAKSYIKYFNDNRHFEILQFCNFEEYDQLIANLINYYPKKKKYMVKVILESFYPLISERTYIRYIGFLNDIREDYPEFTNELGTLINFIIDLFSYYFNNKLSHLKLKIDKADVRKINKYFDMRALFLLINTFAGNVQRKVEELDNAIHNNGDIKYKLFGEQILYVTILSYYISRNTIYKKLDDEFITYTLEKLLEVKNEYFNRIENNNIFLPSLNRISTLVSCYHNILIKYKIENEGKKNVRKYVDDYFDDMFYLQNNIMNILILGEKKKFLLNFVEIINFYNLIDENTDEVGNIYKENFSVLYRKLIYQIIYEINFTTLVTKNYSKYNFRAIFSVDNMNTLSEIGMFISGISLFDSMENLQQRHFAHDFAEFFGKYKEQNYEDPFVKKINPVASIDYIWKN